MMAFGSLPVACWSTATCLAPASFQRKYAWLPAFRFFHQGHYLLQANLKKDGCCWKNEGSEVPKAMQDVRWDPVVSRHGVSGLIMIHLSLVRNVI